jgi:hypothetical protein
MNTNGQDIDRTHDVTWSYRSALGAVVYPAVFAPLPAYGTRLRAICLVYGDRPSSLIIKLLDDLTRAGSADLLCLHAPDTLRGLVEGLTYIAGGTWKRLRNGVRGLMGGISYLVLRFAEYPILAALQPFPASRTLAGLCLLDAGQRLVTPLNDRFQAASTHQEHFGAIGRGNERIHAQVHADRRLLWAQHVGYFIDQPYDAERQPNLHQPTRQGNGLRQVQTQRATRAMWQEQLPTTNTSILIGVHYVVIARFAPGIACLSLSVLAQLTARLDCLTELTDELLSRLRRDARVPPYGPPLPAHLGGLLPALTANALVTDDQVTPQPCSLFAAGGEGSPFPCDVWAPRDFYRAIAHTQNMANACSIVKRYHPTAAGFYTYA